MNDLFKQIIWRLRHDEDMRRFFDMERWTSHNCATVGCIAGTAVLMAGRRPVREEPLTGVLEGPNGFYTVAGAELLDLPLPVAQHLFKPWNWRLDLRMPGQFEAHYGNHWTSNLAPDLSTVEKMRNWARGFGCLDRISPDKAALVMEALEDHPGWVDWSLEELR